MDSCLTETLQCKYVQDSKFVINKHSSAFMSTHSHPCFQIDSVFVVPMAYCTLLVFCINFNCSCLEK